MIADGDALRRWRRVRDLPLIEAATAVRQFGAWRPPAGPDRALFERLAGADPAGLALALHGCEREPVRLSHDEIVTCAALSADGSRLAVACMPDFDAPSTIREYRYLLSDLSGPCWEHTVDLEVTDLVYAGDTPIARGIDVGEEVRLIRCGSGGLELFAHGLPIGEGDLQPTRRGFVAVNTQTAVLAFGTAGSDDLRVVELDDDLWPGYWPPATEPGANLIALGGDALWVLDGDSGAVIARAGVPGGYTNFRAVVFAGPHRLVAQLGVAGDNLPRSSEASQDAVGTWRLDADTLTFEGAQPYRPPLHRLASLAAHQLVVTTPYRWPKLQGGPLRFHDAVTLRATSAPTTRLDTAQPVISMSSTPDGHHLLLLAREHREQHAYTVEVHELPPRVVALVRRPLGELTAAELAVTEHRHTGADTQVPDLLDVFRACLQHRLEATTSGAEPD